jgi:hopanoid C-2 methylase
MRQQKPRVLVVVAHFDETRSLNGRPYFVPQALGHAYLAGAFHRENVELRIYSEFHSGPLRDEGLFAWPDMLVLTGVTSSFDRMRQLAAYARSKSPGCVIVAGGPVVRNLPVSSAAAFDYACDGDIEELIDVARDVFGSTAAPERMLPRFDLLTWTTPVNYVETSRYCNFRCSFCALTAERRDYAVYDVGYIEQQIRSYPRKRPIMFIDNNFYGNNRAFFLRKLELLKGLMAEGVVPGWVALVTSDFFADLRNLERVREAGCLGLFCGVESFDPALNKIYNKRQNLLQPQVEMIKTCLEAGVLFQYGLIFDPAAQSLERMQNELDFIVHCDVIPTPAFMTLTIPLLGTPHFEERVKSGHFLPLAKLRDMDGFTILTRPLDDIDRVVPFVRSLSKLRSGPGQAARRTLRFWQRYRRSLTARQMAYLSADNVRLGVPGLLGNGRARVNTADDPLTHITTTQPLGPLYRPAFAIPERYRDCFRPTMITDGAGDLAPEIAKNLAARTAAPRRRVAASPPT